MRFLGRRRVKGAEGNIIRPGLTRLHGEMAAVVAGDPDLGQWAEQAPRDLGIAVPLPQMHAVGTEPLREARIVIDDEADVVRRANLLERGGEADGLVLVDALQPELESGHGPGIQRRLQRVRKGPGHLERRHQIELAGRPPRVALELLGEVGAEFVDHVRPSSRRVTAAMKPAGSSSRCAMATRARRRAGSGGSSSSITFG